MIKKTDQTGERQFYHLLFSVLFIFIFWLTIPYVFAERMWPDEALYAWYAQKIFLNPAVMFSKEIIEFHPPLFSLFLSLGHHILPPLIADQSISFLFSMAGIWVMYMLGIRIASPFAGFWGAFFLAFHHLTMFYFGKVLTDSTFMLFVMLLALALLSVKGSSPFKDHLRVGLTAVAVILLKWSAVVVIAWVAAYYLFAFKGLSWRERLLKLSIPLGMIMLTVGSLFAADILQNQKICPVGNYIARDYSNDWYYIKSLPPLLGASGFLFFIAGLLCLRSKQRNVNVLLLSWLAICYGSFSIIAVRDPRYTLIVLPFLVLITVLPFDLLVQRFASAPRRLFLVRGIVMIFCLGQVWLLYPLLKQKLSAQNRSYTGFSEAGQWVRDHLRPDTVILASSPRQMRYFSGINFQQFQGQIREDPFYVDNLKELLSGSRGHIIIEVDNWGEGRLLIDPVAGSQISFLTERGFTLRKTIGQRKYKNSGETVMGPNVWLFERD